MENVVGGLFSFSLKAWTPGWNLHDAELLDSLLDDEDLRLLTTLDSFHSLEKEDY